jgi:hypothetical protein
MEFAVRYGKLPIGYSAILSVTLTLAVDNYRLLACAVRSGCSVPEHPEHPEHRGANGASLPMLKVKLAAAT